MPGGQASASLSVGPGPAALLCTLPPTSHPQNWLEVQALGHHSDLLACISKLSRPALGQLQFAYHLVQLLGVSLGWDSSPRLRS